MRRWHLRKQVVLQMEEHAESDRVANWIADRAGECAVRVTVMMDSPNSKEGGQALPERHRQYTIAQGPARDGAQQHRKTHDSRGKFDNDP
jgi:hypothetical protein